MSSKVFFVVIFLLAASALHAQQRYELTVKEAVDLAFKNVIGLKNAQVDYRIQEARNKEIFGQALPQVTGNIGAQHFLKVPQVLFPQSDEGVYGVLRREGLLPPSAKAPPPALVPFSFQQPWNLSIGATLQQLLFQPDVFVGLQARKTALELSNAFIEQTKQGIRDSAYRRYYAILIAEKQLSFLDSGLSVLQKFYHDDSIMFRNGFSERLSLDRTQVRLNNLRTTIDLVKSGVQISYAALKFALGLSQADTVVLKEELTTETVKEGLLDESFKYEDRAEIKTLEVSKRLRELDVKRNRLGYLPTVALAGNYSVNAMGQRFFTDKNTNWLKSAFVGLNVAVPIFDGFQRKYKTQQARLGVERLDNTITGVKQAIDFLQVASRESLKNALANLDAQERNQQLALKVYNTTKLKFEQGLGSSFEVLQAHGDYQQAQANYFNALYNATVARIGYQSALGKLQ